MSAALSIRNRYEIKDSERDLIGKGGMGTVYRALDLQTGLPVAVKHLKPELVANDPSQVERFAREGEALRQLNHPNIVKVLATAEENNQHYIIMEYMEGGSLRELLDRQPQLPLKQVVGISLELADALTRAHHLHIIHRDIKPGNVLLAEDGTPRLTDFGIAHIGNQSRITQAGTLTGTYAYLSPEACNGLALDGRTDIWSFGVLMYEVLAGEHPFEKDQVAATLSAILSQEPADLTQLRPDTPPHLIYLIEQMMVKNRENRISSVRLVGAELEAIQQGVDTPSKLVGGFRSRFATPTPTGTATPRHNLPNQPTPFIGRTEELAEIAERLANPACRLLTLVGPGGIGKTRLGLQAAENALSGKSRLSSDSPLSPESHSRFANGVFFVALAPLHSAESLVPTIAEAVGFSFYRSSDPDNIGSNPRQQLLDYLQEKQMLLVVDNFEHLLGGVHLMDEILSTAPNVKLLVTSRERLNMQGEWVLNIKGMSFPADVEPDMQATGVKGYSAVQLFLNNAQRLEASFTLNKDNEAAVIRICQLVGGLPLGIELAAAWVQMLTPNEIAEEIESSFDFLETTMRNVPERHRSIRAVFDYSWGLLQPPERDFMSKLSVFQGGFTREAAAAITTNGRPAATLPLLSLLVNKSLLQRRVDGRYQLHELLRQFAAEKLGSLSTNGEHGDNEPETTGHQVCSAHSRYYLKQVIEREHDLNGRKQQAALAELETEVENIRAAWRWAVSNRQEAAISEAQGGLSALFWEQNWLQDGAELFAQAANNLIENQVDNPLLIHQLQTHEAGYRLISGESIRAVEQFEKLLAFFRELQSESDEANVLTWLGVVKSRLAKLDEATEDLNAALEIYRRRGDDDGIAAVLFQLGFITNDQGHYEKSVAGYDEALALRRKTGNLTAITNILHNLAFVAYRQGDVETARAHAEEALALNQLMNNQAGISAAISRLGLIAGLAGDYQAAYDNYLETLTINRELGNPNTIVNSITNLSHVTFKMGRFEESEKFAGELLLLAEKINNRWTMLYAHNNVGLALAALGRYEEARHHLLKGLEIARDMRAVPIALETLTGMAQLFIQEGDKAFALELCSHILNHPALIQDTRDLVRPIYEQLAAEVDEGVLQTAEAQARERDVSWYWDTLLSP